MHSGCLKRLVGAASAPLLNDLLSCSNGPACEIMLAWMSVCALAITTKHMIHWCALLSWVRHRHVNACQFLTLNSRPAHHTGVLSPSRSAGRSTFNVGKDTGVRPIEIFMCSIVKKYGYDKGFEWLMHFV